MEQADKGYLRSISSSQTPTSLFDSSRDLPVGLVEGKGFSSKGNLIFPAPFLKLESPFLPGSLLSSKSPRYMRLGGGGVRGPGGAGQDAGVQELGIHAVVPRSVLGTHWPARILHA